MGELGVQQQFFTGDTFTGRINPEQLPPDADLTGLLLPSGLDDNLIRQLVVRSRLTGINIIACAVASGVVSEDEAYQAFSQSCGFSPPLRLLYHLKPGIPAGQWHNALRSGVMPVTHQNGIRAILFAPDLHDMHFLLSSRSRFRHSADHMILASRRDYEAFIRTRFTRTWMQDRVNHLSRVEPEACANDTDLMRAVAMGILLSIGLLAFMLTHPATATATTLCFGLAFGLWSLIRLITCGVAPRTHHLVSLRDHDLPRYSILVPLYDEAEIAPHLLAALNNLDYPIEKLDIILILEMDDIRTRLALQSMALPSQFSIITVPAMGPRTKPKALVAALPFTRGQLVVVYDAEDKPHPLQLREAAARFRAGGLRLGCLQAPLVITNLATGPITKLFALEYAGLFRVLLPAMARFDLPLPLGGTSNHFRREALNSVGGWDAFNVTEDADLGIRLARNGWQVEMLVHPTNEQAVSTPFAWLKQRRRWFKGWMQTMAVCLRQPVTTCCQLGMAGSLGLAITLLACTMIALVHPLFLVAMLTGLIVTELSLQTCVTIFLALLGYATNAAIAIIGLTPREKANLTPYVLLIPLYWLALSLAAWLAVFELGKRPFHWDKTAHPAA